MSELGDLLSAQSLLLAVNAALYTLWSADMESAIAVTWVGGANAKKVNNTTSGEKVRNHLYTRAVPLLAYSVALTLTLFPASIAVAASLIGHDPEVRYEFDTIGATLVLVHVGFLMFTLHLANRTLKLWDKWSDYKKLPP